MKKSFIVTGVMVVLLMCLFTGCTKTPTAPISNGVIIHDHPSNSDLKLDIVVTFVFPESGQPQSIGVGNNNKSWIWISIKRNAGVSNGEDNWKIVWEGWVKGQGDMKENNICFNHGDEIKIHYKIDNIDLDNDIFFLE
ncbi:MAG: hypothetical protein PHS34_07540 [Candidatus Omnitrophica bacterium]|nr:hypothetical protein [Candidatus Omnitrophota bacterium]